MNSIVSLLNLRYGESMGRGEEELRSRYDGLLPCATFIAAAAKFGLGRRLMPHHEVKTSVPVVGTKKCSKKAETRNNAAPGLQQPTGLIKITR